MKERKEFMSPHQKAQMVDVKIRSHLNCYNATRKIDGKGKEIMPGVMRPGKTAKDRYLKGK